MLLTLIASATLLQTPQTPSAGGDVIATYKLLGRDVAARVPAPERLGPGEFDYEHSGMLYRFRDGALVSKGISNGWAVLKGTYASLQPQIAAAPAFHVKAVIFRNSDILEHDANGVLRQRRSELGDPELERSLSALALGFARAEVAAGGRIRIVPEVTIEEESMRSNVPAEVPFGPAFITEYFAPHVNGGGFEAEDKVYRGPYHSIIFLHAGLTDRPTFGQVHGAPVTGIPYYWAHDATQPQTLANAVFRAWERNVASLAAMRGFNTVPGVVSIRPDETSMNPSFISFSLLGEGWEALTSPNPKYPAVPPATGTPKPWPQIYDAFWANAPRLEPSALNLERPFSGASGLEVVKQASRTLLLVNPEYVPLVHDKLAESKNLKFLGAVDFGDTAALVFESAEVSGTAAQILALPEAPRTLTAPAANTFEPGTAETLRVAGDFVVKSATDTDRGSVAEIVEQSRSRAGWIELIGTPFDAAKTPFLEFWIKATRPEPLEVQVASDGSWPGARFGIFGTVPRASASAVKQISVAPGTAWQKVVVDLRGGASAASLPVLSVRLAPAQDSALYEHVGMGLPTLQIDDLAVTATATGQVNAVADPTPVAASATSEDPEARALFASKLGENSTPEERSALTALLADGSQVARLNAGNAFTRIKHAEAVPALADMSRSINVRQAEIAAKALAFQDTDAAWQALSQNLTGPFDHQRAFAAQQLATKGDKRTSGAISALITSKSWQTRKAAATAIGSIQVPEAGIVLMTFLHETNPAVRLAATRLATPTQNLVAQRLQWSAVNDESDAVRAASYIKLIESPIKGKAEEGYKGVRDDSMVVRLQVLDYIRTHPAEASRTALRLAVADPHPEVRAAALRGFATLPGEVKTEEVQNVIADEDPRVKAALAELAAAKKLALP